VERMKRIENLNVRGVRTQGIMRAACIIRTCIASCQPGALLPAVTLGCGPRVPGSSSPSRYSAWSSEGSFTMD
jgi:hypothetical protein